MQHQRAMPAEVIITDILMPEQEGFETIRELRRDFPTTGIIAMSGGSQIGQR
jgi:YesN/AraC family two-component response regulator